MKKVIFMCINMNVGGTEKALLTMLDEMDKEKYEITILMLEEYGGFLDSIPSYVKIKYVEDFSNMKPRLNNPPIQVAKNLIKSEKLVKGINILAIHLVTKVFGERSLYFKYLLKNYKKIEGEYDLAAAYAGPMDFITYFVLRKIKAKKKVQWIHFDIAKIGFNLKFANKFYGKFDKVFVVSKEGKSKLIERVPSLEKNTEVFFNIVSENKIKDLASRDMGFEDDFNGIRILTVGRLAKEKGQDMTILVLSKLKNEGYKVKWYCIGEGNARSDYESMIKEYKVEEDYILLGSKTNPYPFMKECDIYVQSSRHEGYCITLAEAKILKNSIITTNFTGAKEQIENNETGLISDINEMDLYIKIKRLLDNNDLSETIKNNLRSETTSRLKEIDKLDRLLNI
ncbi:MAG: glycosyltransferase [Romboutsia sp.]